MFNSLRSFSISVVVLLSWWTNKWWLARDFRTILTDVYFVMRSVVTLLFVFVLNIFSRFAMIASRGFCWFGFSCCVGRTNINFHHGTFFENVLCPLRLCWWFLLFNFRPPSVVPASLPSAVPSAAPVLSICVIDNVLFRFTFWCAVDQARVASAAPRRSLPRRSLAVVAASASPPPSKCYLVRLVLRDA